MNIKVIDPSFAKGTKSDDLSLSLSSNYATYLKDMITDKINVFFRSMQLRQIW
jgi:hypothetical protein